MGQKVNPIANRLGIIRGWDSNWFGGKDFSDKLVEDAKIRKYLNVRLAKASISKIIIERTLKLVTVTISTARPGIIIGKGGQEVDKLKEELKKLTGKEIQINIFEVKRPEVDAVIVGQNIARQLEGRVSFRRAVKTAVASTMRMGAEGIKVQVSGRVGGAAQDIEQRVIYVEDADKDSYLLHELENWGNGRILIFVETKRKADILQRYLITQHFLAASIHGDRSQADREDALSAFKLNRVQILVATDVAARGLDIPDVSLVINYDTPQNIEDYVHRIGRTGRAGNTGVAISFINENNRPIARDLYDLLDENSPDFWSG